MDKMDFIIFNRLLSIGEFESEARDERGRNHFRIEKETTSKVLSNIWNDKPDLLKVDDSWKNAAVVVASTEDNSLRRPFLSAEGDSWLSPDAVFYKSEDLIDPSKQPIVITPPRHFETEYFYNKGIEQSVKFSGINYDKYPDSSEEEVVLTNTRKELLGRFRNLSEIFSKFIDLPEFVGVSSLICRYAQAVRALERYLMTDSFDKEAREPIVFTEDGLLVRDYLSGERIFLPDWIFTSDEDELRERILGNETKKAFSEDDE